MRVSIKQSFPRQYHPMLVSNNGTDEKMDPQTTLTLWEAFDRLPKETRIIVSADEVATEIKALQDTFHISDQAIGWMTLFIRQIFFGELRMAEAEAKIGSMLTTTGGGDPNQAKAVVEYIQKKILTIQPTREVSKMEERNEDDSAMLKTVRLPLLEALSKYEQLGNQLITGERIKIKSQPEPVRPSLLYWLKYYRDELGVGHHDSVQRGQFLFQSINGKHLSEQERMNMDLILKSVEENLPLTIDTEHQLVLFPTKQMGISRPSIPATATIVRGPALPGVSSLETLSHIPLSEKITQTRPLHIGEDIHGTQLLERGKSSLPQMTSALTFSANHKFPAEDEALQQEDKLMSPDSKSIPSTVKPVSVPVFNPYRIIPSSQKENEE
ncbi:MAG: hypothetical protein ACSLEX_00280 [Minisyncoccota bacterium]